MLLLQRRKIVDQSLFWLESGIGLTIAVFGASLKANPADWAHIVGMEKTLVWMQGNAWFIVGTGPLLMGIIHFLRRKYGSPWIWETIQSILDDFREEVFGQYRDDPNDHHRVTLFQHRSFAFHNGNLLTDHLIPVARSGHLTKLRIRSFSAPDEASQCQGVAGRAWRGNTWVIVPRGTELLTAPLRFSPPDIVRRYCEMTFVDEKTVMRELRDGRQFSSSFAAISVQVKGRKWGVLVLDSKAAGSINPATLQRFRAYGQLLAPLLERA